MLKIFPRISRQPESHTGLVPEHGIPQTPIQISNMEIDGYICFHVFPKAHSDHLAACFK